MHAPLEKPALANLETLHRIFTVPESGNSTLAKIEREISENVGQFLQTYLVATNTPIEEIERQFLDSVIPEAPRFVSDHADYLLEQVVPHSVHTAAPSFIGHMTSAVPYFMLPLAKIMLALNQNLVKVETSKVFTPLERQVLGMLHRLVYAESEEFYRTFQQDREKSLGVFCSGGTIANMTALWVARNQLLCPRRNFRGVMEDGLAAGLKAHGLEQLAVLVSQRGHYSLDKAIDLLGLGKNNLVRIATNAQNKIEIKALRDQIAQLKNSKVGLLAIIGIAGTTETGNIDPLPELAEIAREQRCHFHVDAAWGGPTLFSKQHRKLVAGIESADSVTIDAHKQLYVPMGAGMVLFKDPTALKAIEQSAQYIIREGSRDLGRRSLEGSRPGMALLVDAALKIIGQQGYALLIDQGVAKAKLFAEMIDAEADFELISPPELNLLTYRFCGDGSLSNAQLNELTVQIQKEQREAGKSFVSRTQIEFSGQPTTVFRVVLANPLTSEKNLQDVLREQREIAERLIMR
ncbi:putative pyridoxal-dependent aspartate 1-decarboxylase [bacterium]|nr:putative pyridoxal-dependent aspartate 1-decarboxylase [bacterium]